MWTLLISRTSDAPGSFYDRRQLDSGQIIVGRSDKKCDLVLPDEEGFVSREHCTISVVGLELFVVDTSKNGVVLNQGGSRIAPGLPVPIRPNDRLVIGKFVITIATEAMGAGVSLVPPPPPPLPTQQGLGTADPFFAAPSDPIWDAGPMDGGGLHDFLSGPLNDLLAPASNQFDVKGSPSDFGFADPIGQAFSRPIMADPLPAPSDFGIPEDWAAPSPAANASPSTAPDPFAGPPPAFPPDWDLPAPGISDPFGGAAPISDPFAPGGFGSAPPPGDPFDLGPRAAPPGEDWASPAPVSPAPAPAPSASMGAAPAGWDAFFEGAGLSPGELQLSPDAMRRMGVLYRQVVLGLADIMQDRAAFKDEFRVERTQLSIGRNNPLKHLPPLDAAKVLLGDPLPGFMPADEAVRTAFEDIKKHQLAMLAGVQQALSAVFDRLAPAEIEKVVEKAMAQRRGLPFGRGIDRWSVYLTVFEALKKDATSNANGVMSVAFREGYEKFLKSAL